jgi:hypothetical protein
MKAVTDLLPREKLPYYKAYFFKVQTDENKNIKSKGKNVSVLY